MTEVEAKKPQETLQDRLAQVVDLLQRRHEMAAQHLARFGQRHAPCCACQQARVQPRLEPRDALADRRAGQVKALGRGLEAAQVGHADEHVDALEAFRRIHVPTPLMNCSHFTR